MAIELVTITPRYIGTATERAAMDPPPEHIGAEFFESDTGLTYVFCGGTTWALKLHPATEPAE